MSEFKDVAHKTVAELFDMLKEKQAEVDQLKAEIEGLKNPNLAQHTKKYREQCELFKSMSEVEKKAYSAGYDWACKVSQRQILTLIKDQEGVEDRLDNEIDNLKAQLNNMEQCYIEKKKEREDQHKKVDEVLEYLDGESANRWGLWKEKADMLDQGASNAFEEAYWMAKKVLRGGHE